MAIDFDHIQVRFGIGKSEFPMYKGSFSYLHETTWQEPQKAEFLEVLENPEEAWNVISAAPEGTAPVGEGVHKLILRPEGGMPERSSYNRVELTLPVDMAEHFYGCGETFAAFDLRGQLVRIWVAEHQNEKRIEAKIQREKEQGKTPHQVFPIEEYESYYAQPTFLSSDRYFLHVDHSQYMEFDFREEGSIKIRMHVNDGLVPDFWLGVAADFETLSAELTELLGRPRQLPDWVYDGVILAVQWGSQEVDKKLQIAKEAEIPVVGVWCQDWCGCRNNPFGYQVMWNWRYEEELYPNLPGKIDKWKAQGVHFLGYINPFLAIEKELYAYASERGYLVKNPAGEDYMVTITHFPAAMIDFTNPKAYRWYKELIKKNLLAIGINGWMADFGEYLPTDAVLYNGDRGENWHNEWPAIWAGLNWEAIHEYALETGTREEDYFFFTRAGFTGTILAGGMMWTGDQHVDFSLDDGLGSVIPATLSLAASGNLLTHSDVGGYTTKEGIHRSAELLMRWEEMNAFSPLMRFHEGNQPWNNVQFDGSEEVLRHLSRMSRMHVGLKPYLKEVVKEAAVSGFPAMRPLFYYYPEERAYEERFEYLLGRDILVAPVLDEGAVTREVYFPKDTWLHLLTGEEYTGGVTLVEAPLGLPPVFIRKSSPWAEKLLS